MDYKKKWDQNIKKARKTFDHTSEALVDKMSDAHFYTTKYVKKNPLKTVGLSLLMGAVFSKLLHFRK